MLDSIKGKVGDIAAYLYTKGQTMPRPLRVLLRDILEGAATGVASVQLFVPANADDARKLAVTVFVAASAAIIAVVRRWIWQQFIDKVSGDPS